MRWKGQHSGLVALALVVPKGKASGVLRVKKVGALHSGGLFGCWMFFGGLPQPVLLPTGRCSHKRLSLWWDASYVVCWQCCWLYPRVLLQVCLAAALGDQTQTHCTAPQCVHFSLFVSPLCKAFYASCNISPLSSPPSPPVWTAEMYCKTNVKTVHVQSSSQSLTTWYLWVCVFVHCCGTYSSTTPRKVVRIITLLLFSFSLDSVPKRSRGVHVLRRCVNGGGCGEIASHASVWAVCLTSDT